MARYYKSKPAGPSPPSRSMAVSRSMKSNRRSGTKPELILSRLLRKKLVSNNLPGQPDFIYPRARVAIFVQGCFWHRCPIHGRTIPRTNTEFWQRKFNRNEERDRLNKEELEAMGWRVLVVWEHEIKENRYRVAERIRRATASFK